MYFITQILRRNRLCICLELFKRFEARAKSIVQLELEGLKENYDYFILDVISREQEAVESSVVQCYKKKLLSC